MIILDGTIVNVALPTIQDDLGFAQSDLAWVVNAYLIAFGGLLLLAGPARRPDRPPPRLPHRPHRVHRGLAAVRPRRQPGDADRRPLRPGDRRRDDLRRDPRDDRDDVPRAARAGEGDRGLQLRRLRAARRSACWPAASSPRPSRGTGSSSSTSRSGSRPACSPCGCSRRRPARACKAGADALGAVLVTVALMLGVYTIVQAGEQGWGSRADARARRRVAGAARRLRRPPGDRGDAAAAAAAAALAPGGRGERRPGADGRRAVRRVLPRRPLPAAGARLRRDRDRPRVPARLARDRDPLARLLGAAGHALRAARGPARRPRVDRRRARRCSPRSRSTAATSPTCCPRCC